jgi:hypothetical protein
VLVFIKNKKVIVYIKKMLKIVKRFYNKKKIWIVWPRRILKKVDDLKKCVSWYIESIQKCYIIDM